MTTLLESKARPFGSSKGVALSMVLHGVLLAAIVFGTAKAVLPPREKIEEHPVLYVASPPPPPIESPKPLPVVKAPPKVAAPKHVFVAPPPKAAPQPVAQPRPTIAAPAKLALSIPAVDVKLAPVAIDVSPTIAEPAKPTAEPTGGSAKKSGDDAEASGRSAGGLGSGSAGRAFSENQVERTAEVTRGASPHYPESLRSVNVEGEVVMQFIVSADGKVEPGSMDVKSSPHKLFSEAVRVALMSTRYRPAEVGGKPVRQLVEQTFRFSLGK
jgi:TonB family protein